ncbi:hypothetical protein [Mucilaginibacter sp.]|uniref:hypothetical protein n=1 Tax=Mucilaginibacter sp. TaxID=1882438 RepID=UPI0032678751
MKIFYFAALFLFPLLSLAQSNYKVGYAINLKGDTLKGYIDYKEWGKNPTSIHFKSALREKAKLLTAHDIKYFEIADRAAYELYTVGISINRMDIASPPSLKDTASSNGTVFLKILNTGKNVTLYSYADGIKKRFYVKEGSQDVPAELVYGIYQNPEDLNNFIERNTYRNQLSKLAIIYKPSDVKLMQLAQRAAYRGDELGEITNKVNGDNASKVSYTSGNPIFRLFAGAALKSSTLKYPVKSLYYDASPSTSVFPKITAGVDLMVKPDIGNLILRLELGYTQSNYDIVGKPDPLYNEADPITYNLKLRENVISLTPQLVYNFYNTAALKVFADLGYSLNILSLSKNEVSKIRGGSPITTVTTPDNLIAKDYASFQFKTGIVLNKRLEIYGAYYNSVDATRLADMATKLSSYQVGFNYFFGRVSK